MTHRSVRNEAGQLIHHTAAGRTKDPATWKMLDDEAKARKAQAGQAPGNGSGDLINILENIDEQRRSAAGKSTGAVQAAAPTAGAPSMDSELEEAIEAGSDPWGVFGINAELAGVQLGATPDRTVGLAIAQFWALTPDEMRGIQKRLYAGGFYPTTYYPRGGRAPTNFIAEGVADEVTYNAFQDVVIKKARQRLAQ
jgi:hypothetical protein